ncbi:hypothetical protein ACP56K_004353 [Escherichia coli]
MLFRRGSFFKRNTAFSVEFPDRSLQHNVEILPDKYGFRANRLFMEAYTEILELDACFKD